jgi:hypothetical protein
MRAASGPGPRRRGPGPGEPLDARERDARGRPRNARPRDGLGRPLPRGADGVPRVPDDFVLPPGEALLEAQRLLDAGRPFHAHEVLEATWKAADARERALWQGLAQLAVGLTHLDRGNAPGAAALLRRGRDRIAGYRPAPYGIDVPALVSWATAGAERLDTGAGTDLPAMPRLAAAPRSSWSCPPGT